MDINTIMDRHKQTVSNLLLAYDGKEPLHLFLKKYFAVHKKHGSKDRKLISALLYSYFRLGKNVEALQKLPDASITITLSDLLDIGYYITGNAAFPQQLHAALQAALNKQDSLENIDSSDSRPPVSSKAMANNAIENAQLPVERFALLQRIFPSMQPALLFPFKAPLSTGLTPSAVAHRLLMQPPVFLRIRPTKGNRALVLKVLVELQLPHTIYDGYTLSMPAGTPVHQFLEINKEVVIQDSSSQWMGKFMQSALTGLQKNNGSNAKNYRPVIKAWDCCAASGGKSILLHDLCVEQGYQPDLTVTDIRGTILKNLDTRFKQAGIVRYHKQILDLTTAGALTFKEDFDLVICDVPCSGSGTWARNPENIRYFNEAAIMDYYKRQISIARKAWQAVRPGGYFLYMTCSVFEQENEAVSDFIAANSGMERIDQKVVLGWPENYVSMFGALYTRKK